jgi:hypothetical protein
MLDSSGRLHRIAENDAACLVLVSVLSEFLYKDFERLDLVEICQLDKLVLQVTQVHMSLLLN